MLKNLFGGKNDVKHVITEEEIVAFQQERLDFNKQKAELDEKLRLARAEIKAFKKAQDVFYKAVDSFNENEEFKKGAAVEMLSREELNQAIRDEGRKTYENEKALEEQYLSFARNIAQGYFFEKKTLVEEALFSTNRGQDKSYSVSILVELKNSNKQTILLVDKINTRTISYEIKCFDTIEEWEVEKDLRGWN